MKKLAILLFMIIVAATSVQGRGFITAGYLHSSWVKPGSDLECVKHVDRLYFFGLIPDKDGNFAVKSHYQWALDTVKTLMRPGQELIIAVGGGAKNSVIYTHTMGTDPQKRKAYVKELVRYVKEQKVDGVDMDWEASPRLGKTVPTEDLLDILTMLRKQLPKKAVMTAALSRRKDCAEQGAAVMHLLDDISVMLYGQLDTKNHLQMPLSLVQEVLSWYRDAGIPNGKIVPGVSFYGQLMDQPKGQPKVTRTYKEIEPTLPEGDTSTFVWDGYSFDSVEKIVEKRNWYKEQGYKGIMIWELSQDAPYSNPRSLLRALNEK